MEGGGWVGNAGRNSIKPWGGGVRPVGSGHGSYMVRAVWRPPALGPHTGLGACCSRRHGGRDVTIVSREHVWQDSTDLTSGHETLKRIALTIAKANAGEKIRGAEYVRTGRMPKHEETAGLFSGFGGGGGGPRRC